MLKDSSPISTNRVSFIGLDVESGGLDTSKSLLTAYLVILDKDMNIVDELDLRIKPNDGIYHLAAEAMAVNGIDIIKHDAESITASDAATSIYNFLEKNNPKGMVKLIPIGHNVVFDIEFICAHTLSKKSWQKYCSYRTLDTGTISQFLIERGELPDMKASLGTLAAHFGIEFVAHTAKGDTLACVEVMKRFLNK